MSLLPNKEAQEKNQIFFCWLKELMTMIDTTLIVKVWKGYSKQMEQRNKQVWLFKYVT